MYLENKTKNVLENSWRMRNRSIQIHYETHKLREKMPNAKLIIFSAIKEIRVRIFSAERVHKVIVKLYAIFKPFFSSTLPCLFGLDALVFSRQRDILFFVFNVLMGLQ